MRRHQAQEPLSRIRDEYNPEASRGYIPRSSRNLIETFAKMDQELERLANGGNYEDSESKTIIGFVREQIEISRYAQRLNHQRMEQERINSQNHSQEDIETKEATNEVGKAIYNSYFS